jgi:DNA-binding XRE family transcriptional regulator
MRVDGIAIKRLREERDLKKYDIAQAADLCERSIEQLEQGVRCNINLNVAKAIAAKLGVKLDLISKF